MNLRDEFNYHAVTLIFGLRSPKIAEFKIYSLDIMQKHPELRFIERSNLTSDNVPDTCRELMITPHRCFVADHCRMSSGVCRVITFTDSQHKIHKIDDIFTEREYEYFSLNWDDTVKNKIRTLGMLLRSVYEGKLIEIPLLINEYPNITGVLLQYPDTWVK